MDEGNIGERIAQLRVEAGLSQRELAEKLTIQSRRFLAGSKIELSRISVRLKHWQSFSE